MISLPLPLLLPLGWHKKFGPRAKLLVPSAPIPPSCHLSLSLQLPLGWHEMFGSMTRLLVPYENVDFASSAQSLSIKTKLCR